MDGEKTWTVVQFLDDSTVEAVPSPWIQGELCHWPSFSLEKVAIAIKKWEPLNTCWPLHKVKVFRNATFDDYSKAREKTILAEETSDLCSDRENTLSKKRKIIQKVFSSSDDSLDESILPPAPKKSKCSGSKATARNSTVKISPTKTVEIPRTVQAPEEVEDLAPNDGTYKKLSNQINLVRELVCDCLTEIKKMYAEMKKKNISFDSLTMKKSFFENFKSLFPIQTKEKLTKLEELLEIEENFSSCVSELSKLGGVSTYEFVKRAMKIILSDEVAKMFSWYGKKGKLPFSNMETARLVIYAAENARVSDSKKETETNIQLWLKRASDRLKSKKP